MLVRSLLRGDSWPTYWLPIILCALGGISGSFLGTAVRVYLLPDLLPLARVRFRALEFRRDWRMSRYWRLSGNALSTLQVAVLSPEDH